MPAMSGTARFAALELENAQQYREARRALKERDKILGIVAHDLRNPLSTILMSAELLRDVPLTEEQRMHQIDVVLSSGRRMKRLIQDLLDVARVENEQLPLDLDVQRPHELVRDAVALNITRAAGRSLDLRVGDCDTTACIRADRDRLLQVLCNLIENAIKYTPEGGTIDVCAMPIDSGVSFTVRDSGPGIPEADLGRVFDTFWQKNRPSIEGAGLGLAIARGIVEAHGGTIGVESTVGIGSTFWFTIPSA